MNAEETFESDEGKVPHIYLDDDGADGVFVCVNTDGELEIDAMVFSADEARKLRNFLNSNFGG